MSEKLLEVKNLRVSYHTYAGEVQSVRGVSFTVNKGETVAVVGESGCGKSVTAKSIMRLIKTPPAEIKEGSEIIFDGEDVLQFNEKRLCAYRGGEVAMVFQDALAALNPTMTVGNQIIENLRHHTKLSKKEAKARAVELLRMVGIPQPESRVDQYPHEFSGGMRQRVMIAIAFACDPKLLIADEPTTALDVTIQARSSTSSRRCRKKRTPRSSSSPTTWALWPISRTASWSCTPARSWSGAPALRCSTTRATPTPTPCWKQCPAWTCRTSSSWPASRAPRLT